MTDKTLGIIYAMKRSEKSWDRAVIDWMADYSGSDPDFYTESVINTVLQEAFVDYVSTCDHPEWVVHDLLDCIKRNGAYSLGHSIAVILAGVRVKDGKKFINGFR